MNKVFTSTLAYDSNGRLLTATNANPDTNKDTATNEFDDLGRMVATIDYDGHRTEFEYDKLGRVIQTRVLPDNSGAPPISLSTTEFDAHGNATRTITYDAERLLADDGADLASLPATAEDLIDLVGNSAALPFLHEVRSVFDTLNRASETIYVSAAADGLGGNTSTRKVYDGAGRVRFSIDELGHQTESSYDGYGRLQQITLPDPDGGGSLTSPVVINTYDAVGNVTAVKHANGNIEYSAYDTFNRLVAPTDGEGNTKRTIYDIVGQVVVTVDALNRAAYVLVDKRGRAEQEWMPDPDSSGPLSAPVTRKQYDANGNLASVVAANGYRTTYQYDELNRLEKEITTDVHVIDNGSSGSFDFPQFHVPYSTSTVNTNSVTSFKGDNIVIAGTSSHRAEAYWVFDDLPVGTYRAKITWQADSALDATAEVGITGMSTAIVIDQTKAPSDSAFDNQGRWLGWKNLDYNIVVATAGQQVAVGLYGHGVGTTVKISADAVMLERTVEKSFEYDGNGNQTKVTNTLGQQTLSEYDELGRLKKTTLPDPDGASSLQSPVSETTFDGFGNIKSVIGRRGSAADRKEVRTYDKRNRLTQSIANYQNGTYNSSATDEDIITMHEFDDAGNLRKTTKAFGSAEAVVTEYEYDNLNRVKAEALKVDRWNIEPRMNMTLWATRPAPNHS